MNHLRNYLKSHNKLYVLSLTLVTLLRLIRIRFQSFPQPSGWSNFDFIPNRKGLIGIQQKYTPQKPPDTDALILALAEDRKRIARIKESSKRVSPISFSWPAALSPTLVDSWEARNNFSQVVPGEPYAFSDYELYMQQYRKSKFAVTIKKGGWDCFRHIEIMAAGGIPIMPDISKCPKWAMAFYPKAAMREVVRQILENREIDKSFAEALQNYFIENLTCEAMARQLLDKVGFSGDRVVFLDPHLNAIPEYLSVMTYVGFKRTLGRDATFAPFGAGPVYQDWQGEVEKLHGLGFGYTKLLQSNMRSTIENESDAEPFSMTKLREVDLVVVGSLSRNVELANQVNELGLPPNKVIYLWGDDRSPSRRDLRWLKQLRGQLFFRELYGGDEAAKYLVD